jgi:hypothetical protein
MPTPTPPSEYELVESSIENWGYRLVKEDDIIQMAEVHYRKNGKPYGYTNADVMGADLEEVQEVCKMMQPAFDAPILDAKTDFVEGSNEMKKELQDLKDDVKARWPEQDYDDWQDAESSGCCPVCKRALIDEVRHGAGI